VLAFSHRTSGEQKRCRVLFWRFRAGQSSKYRQPVQSADAPKAGHIFFTSIALVNLLLRNAF
jgi:hypothetical protein